MLFVSLFTFRCQLKCKTFAYNKLLFILHGGIYFILICEGDENVLDGGSYRMILVNCLVWLQVLQG